MDKLDEGDLIFFAKIKGASTGHIKKTEGGYILQDIDGNNILDFQSKSSKELTEAQNNIKELIGYIKELNFGYDEVPEYVQKIWKKYCKIKETGSKEGTK
jgi:hypothetical protein